MRVFVIVLALIGVCRGDFEVGHVSLDWVLDSVSREQIEVLLSLTKPGALHNNNTHGGMLFVHAGLDRASGEDAFWVTMFADKSIRSFAVHRSNIRLGHDDAEMLELDYIADDDGCRWQMVTQTPCPQDCIEQLSKYFDNPQGSWGGILAFSSCRRNIHTAINAWVAHHGGFNVSVDSLPRGKVKDEL